MDWRNPHQKLEPLSREESIVHDCLEALASASIIPHTMYDSGKMMAMRKSVQDQFDIPWTAITPRMQRLLYAVNAISQPKIMVAVGIFCGFTFISNAGAAIGPGSCYQACRSIGIEIRKSEAKRARNNVARIAPPDQFEIVHADGVKWLKNFQGEIDLLYLDANGKGAKGKSIYLDILQSSLNSLKEGGLVLAHNSVNSSEALSEYLAFVRSPRNFQNSLNAVIDDQGLEISKR